MLVSEFVKGFNNLKNPELQRNFCNQHLVKKYASIVQKNAVLKNFADGCVKRNDSGISYLDMVANKMNMTWAIVFLYTDLTLDEVEDTLKDAQGNPVTKKRQDVIGLYDQFQEYGIINVFCDLIGERELNELLMVNNNVIETWHEEHSSARAFVSELTDKAVRTFVEMTALMQEAITPADREKLSETIKQFVGVSDEETK